MKRQTDRQRIHTHSETVVSCQLCVLPALADAIHDTQKPKGYTNFLMP